MVPLLIHPSRRQSLCPAEGSVMSWKRERDGLIAQTLAFVQSVTGRRDGTVEPIAPLPSETEARDRPSVGPAALLAVETALGAAAPSVVSQSVVSSVNPKVAPQGFEPPKVAAESPSAPLRRPIVQSEMASEIRARVASFRAHQERFSREREEYFAATLSRLRAAIKDAPPPPPRPGK
jgi:hypothetical protein